MSDLVICVFSILLNQLRVSSTYWRFYWFFSSSVCPFSVSLISALLFIISFLLFYLELIWCSFYSFLKWNFRKLVLNPFSFSKKAFQAKNFPLSTVLAASHKFEHIVFSLDLVRNILNFLCDLFFDLCNM